MNCTDFINIVSPYSMTSIERISTLYDSLEYIRKNDIHGDIIECGVWKGGNILGIIKYIDYYNMYNKQVWLFDTFQGMTNPDDIDIDYKNNSANNIFKNPEIFCYSSLEDVKNNINNLSFNKDLIKINFVIGDVSETLQNKINIPNEISLLRLDTDWYKSTKDELEYLYPNLVSGGVLIVDDYGHWNGSRKAVDEFFNDKNVKLEKIDYTGVKIIKD